MNEKLFTAHLIIAWPEARQMTLYGQKQHAYIRLCIYGSQITCKIYKTVLDFKNLLYCSCAYQYGIFREIIVGYYLWYYYSNGRYGLSICVWQVKFVNILYLLVVMVYIHVTCLIFHFLSLFIKQIFVLVLGQTIFFF